MSKNQTVYMSKNQDTRNRISRTGIKKNTEFLETV